MSTESNHPQTTFDEVAARKKFGEEVQKLGPTPTPQVLADLFLAHFMDPANGAPYESAEGGYLYVAGGPYSAREELEFYAPLRLEDATLDAAVELIEDEGTEWVFREQY